MDPLKNVAGPMPNERCRPTLPCSQRICPSSEAESTLLTCVPDKLRLAQYRPEATRGQELFALLAVGLDDV